ncbi:MAG: hypothetical protein LBR08_06620 [Bacteroidales bacterium]|jgi:hypothetical protein|nr:hypothetical protein [Bacteroidales bacterium]
MGDFYIFAASSDENKLNHRLCIKKFDTLDKSFGLNLGSNRRQAVLQKIGKTQK